MRPAPATRPRPTCDARREGRWRIGRRGHDRRRHDRRAPRFRPFPGRVLINERWVSAAAPMSALEPKPDANPRIWALPPVARSGNGKRLNIMDGNLVSDRQVLSGPLVYLWDINRRRPKHGEREKARSGLRCTWATAKSDLPNATNSNLKLGIVRGGRSSLRRSHSLFQRDIPYSWISFEFVLIGC